MPSNMKTSIINIKAKTANAVIPSHGA